MRLVLIASLLLCAGTIEAQVTTTLPHVADGNGFDTLVLLINTGTADASYSLAFFTQTGSPVSYPLDPSQSGMTGTIHAGSQAIVRTTGSGGSTHLGWGQLTAPSTVNGMLIYQQQASPTSLQEGSAPFTAPSMRFFVPFDNVGTATTSIGFANPSATQIATVNFTVRYESGGSDTVPAFTMNARQQIANTVTGIWGNTAGKRGMIEVNVNTPISLVAFRFQGTAFTLVDTIPPTAGGSAPITSTIAHTADGNNFRSTFLLTNTGTADASYSLAILNATGQPQTFGFDVISAQAGTVPAGSTRTVDTTGLGATTNLGWAQLSAPPAVSGIEVFRQTNPGQSEQQATIPISQTNLAHFMMPFDNAGNTTSIALSNPDSAVTATVNVTFRYVDGTSNTGQLTLLPRNYTANLLASLFPATTGKAGVAEFSSNVPIAVVEVRFNPTQAFTSLRAVPAGSQGGGIATATAERALAQTGLAIGLASTVLQSQFLIAVGMVLPGQYASCTALPGGGSVRLAATMTVYFDSNCTQPYIVTGAGTTLSNPGDSQLAIAETATYYNLNGTILGTMTLNETAQVNNPVVLYGLGVFTPASGARTPVQLGVYCTLTAPGDSPCAGGIAQDFPALGIAIGAVTPLTLTIGSQISSPVPFTGGGSAVSGPLGSLTLTNPSSSSLVIQGGTAYGTTTASGSSSAFELFPPPPTSWTLIDAAHDQQFQISVAASRSLTVTITQVSTGATLASGTLDQSGSGSISYSDGTSAAIANWTLAD